MTPGTDFTELLAHLREQRGVDFTGYKRPTLERRVAREMHRLDVETHEEYLDRLQVDPEAVRDLFDALLINVTSFFRDPDVWDHLERAVVPGLVQGEGPLRLWSAGCASGQEAYSMAMLLAEHMEPEDFRRRVKVYATDIDVDALTAGRAAAYRPREQRGLSPERLDRHIVPGPGDARTIRPELRRSVVFGRNDLVQDAPIGRVDLLLCRNTLMYYDAEVQARVVHRLHFAMAPDGVLVVGKAESLLSHASYFSPLDGPRRTFRRRDVAPAEDRLRLGPPPRHPQAPVPDDVHRLLAEALRVGPAAQLVLDRSARLVVANARAEELLGLHASDRGRPFQDLEVSYRPVELRAPLLQARTERQPVSVLGVEAQREGRDVVLDVVVVPLADGDGAYAGASVTFVDASVRTRLEAELEQTRRRLDTAYEELQSANEELETTNEELQSTVEELETTNEELQSTNEELETMNEELAAVNEELYAREVAERAQSLVAADLLGLLEAALDAVSAAVVAVDDGGVVQVWSDVAEDVFGVRADEAVGVRLAQLDVGLPVADLEPLALQALGDGGALHARVPAVSRRGRAIDVDVTARAVGDGSGERTALLVLLPVGTG